MKDRMRTVIAKIVQLLLQNLLQEKEYRVYVWRASNGAHTELASGVKKFLTRSLHWCAFNYLWMLLSCQ
jgi:hypothetical protein